MAGYNRYLRDTRIENLPDPSCRGAQWVREIREIDVYRRFYQLAMLASSGVAINGIGSAQPPIAGLIPSILPSAQEIATQLQSRWEGIQIGSNAIALGGEATAKPPQIIRHSAKPPTPGPTANRSPNSRAQPPQPGPTTKPNSQPNSAPTASQTQPQQPNPPPFTPKFTRPIL